MADRPDRSSMLLEAGLALASELSLDAVLRRIIELATRITGARYGALGVIGHDGLLSDFLTVGVSDEEHRAIGSLPIGRGILGVLIQEARPLRLPEISRDPRSVGFPPNHPPMTSFLGAPVMARGRVFGNIYLTEKQGAAEFDDEDERAIVILATQAGVAIENARLYEEAARREQRLDAIREVSAAILAGSAQNEILELVARRARELVGADQAAVTTRAGTGRLAVEIADGRWAAELIGLEFDAEGSLSAQVMETGRGELVHDLAADPRNRQRPGGRDVLGPAMVVPLAAHDRAYGTLMIANGVGGRLFEIDDLSLLQAFATQAAVALEYVRTRSELQRLMVVEDRERIAKELHDGAIQSLFAVGMALQGTATMAGEEPVRERIESAVGEVDKVIRDLRNYIFGLRPGILADRQLDQALREIVQDFQERTGILTIADISLEAAAELASRAGDIVQLTREALSNVARHSGADTCRITLARRGGEVLLEVDDDGKGFDPEGIVAGQGLVNLRSRTEALGGEFAIESPPEGGTVVQMRLPG